MRQHPRLFEISAWPWLERMSRREGRRVTLADVPGRDWDALVDWRIDVLFLMGVWRRSPIGREMALADPGLRAEYDRVLPGWTPDDIPGSPYCIQAYEPDDRMGGWDGLAEARRQLDSRGIGLILDFVPNHTSFDHAWLSSHPDRYVLGSEDDVQAAPSHFHRVQSGGVTHHVACGRDPYFEPWKDVAQLNYFNPDTRRAMHDTLRLLSTRCDGVRCDMAMLALNEVFDRTWRRVLRDAWPVPGEEFWPEAKTVAPGLMLLAEVYWGLEGRMLDLGFDFVYGKDLLDALHSGDAHRARHALGQPRAGSFAWFAENHDEPRSHATLANRLPASTSIVATAPGMRFFYDGQFEGRTIKSPVQLGRWADEQPDARVAALHESVLQFASDDVFYEGTCRLPPINEAGDDTHHSLVAIEWTLRDQVALVVANLGDRSSQAHLDIAANLPNGTAFDFEDALTGESYRWTRDALLQRGLYVRLNAGDAHAFRVRTVG